MRQAGGELAQRRQPVGPAHGFLGLLDVQICLHKLFRRPAVLLRLHAQILRQGVHQVAHHHNQGYADCQRREESALRMEQERKVGADGQGGKGQRPRQFEGGSCRHHRQQGHRPIIAGQAAGPTHQDESEDHFQDDPEDAAGPGRRRRNLGLQDLCYAKADQRDDFERAGDYAVGVAIGVFERGDYERGEDRQPDEIARPDQPRPRTGRVDGHA